MWKLQYKLPVFVTLSKIREMGTDKYILCKTHSNSHLSTDAIFPTKRNRHSDKLEMIWFVIVKLPGHVPPV